jgi:hypothetical protein
MKIVYVKHNLYRKKLAESEAMVEVLRRAAQTNTSMAVTRMAASRSAVGSPSSSSLSMMSSVVDFTPEDHMQEVIDAAKKDVQNLVAKVRKAKKQVLDTDIVCLSYVHFR